MHKIFRNIIYVTFFVFFSSQAIAYEYKVGFSPYGKSQEIILNAIMRADSSILVAAYSFTSKPIATALVDAQKRGVKVRVLADKKGNSNKYTAVTHVANNGIDVRLNDKYPIMHHKFMIIDGQHVQLGSFNYSKAAFNRNAENVLYLRNVPDIASQYTHEWQRLWQEGIPLLKQY